MQSCLDGARVFLFPEGLGKKRRALFAAQIARLGGKVAPHPRGATHLVLEGSQGGRSDEGGQLVSTQWLSECIKQGRWVSEQAFLVGGGGRKRAASAAVGDGAEVDAKVSRPDGSGTAGDRVGNAKEGSELNCNTLLVQELQKLGDAYKNSGDKWRNFAYTKAIGAIKSYGKPIGSFEEALALPGLGEKMASKVWELLETGMLQRAEELCGTEEAQTLAIFNRLWGAGPTTAQNWYGQGFRTLDDLRTKASLTRQQLIGLKYYEEIQLKIPRSEVEKITEFVQKIARDLEPDVWSETCGSFRRGKDSCGDIDIVFSVQDESINKTFLPRLLLKLKETKFVTDDLSGSTDVGSHKFLGICQFSPSGLHRRLDLFVVPWGERGCALVHYTGSAHFNRSLRRLAIKKNMTLSDHALVGPSGVVVPTDCERGVFEALGVEFRPPSDREHALEVV